MDIDQILFVMSRDFVIKKIVKALYPVNILHLLQTMGAYGEISKGVLLLHAEDVSYCNGLEFELAIWSIHCVCQEILMKFTLLFYYQLQIN